MYQYTTTPVEDAETGDLIIDLPTDMLEDLKWRVGDTLEWKLNDDDSISLTKKEDTDIVLVETISVFRMRYAVRVPKGKDDWALDTIICDNPEEFSQKHLDETIVSHRILTEEQYVELFDEDNDYLKNIEKQKKIDYIVKV